MLEEVGEPYQTKWLDYGPPMKGPDYLALNPMSKLPAGRERISRRPAAIRGVEIDNALLQPAK
jgi:hypothetical protein